MIFTAHQISLGDGVRQYGMDRKCRMYGIEEKCRSGSSIKT